MSDVSLRLEKLESRHEIKQLAVRYAEAVNARDIDGLLNLFVDDVDCGRRGKGRAAFRIFAEPTLRTFYRAVHAVRCHVIDRLEGDHAEGRVYGRCEQECGDQWIVQSNCYFDTYERREGNWYFVHRKEDFYYSADVIEHPQEAGFRRWPGAIPRHDHSMMMGRYSSWAAFWRGVDTSEITSTPERSPHPGIPFTIADD